MDWQNGAGNLPDGCNTDDVGSDPVAVYYCYFCGCEIYAGDYFYVINDQDVCEDCLQEQHRRQA